LGGLLYQLQIGLSIRKREFPDSARSEITEFDGGQPRTGYNAHMKYSLRSLMIVVTLAGMASGLFARSRQCGERAAFHRGQLPSSWIRCGEPEMKYPAEDWLKFHEESAIALERVAKMPWLPLSLPQPPAPVDPQKEREKEQAMDAIRTNLAQEARDKYGVP